MSGTLYIVATPIGNLEDLSARLVETLKRVEIVAAEDTRRSMKLLQHLNLKKRMIRCDEAREESAGREILRSLADGLSVAMLSDAGTPAIADPGGRLVAAVVRENHNVVPIPGPSAVTTALSASGFKAVPFTFFGFLPKKGMERRSILGEIATGWKTSVFFESPFRIQKTLRILAEMEPDRPAIVARELTKMHETIERGSLSLLADRIGSKNPKGEFTVVVAPPDKREARTRRKTSVREGEE